MLRENSFSFSVYFPEQQTKHYQNTLRKNQKTIIIILETIENIHKQRNAEEKKIQ